MSSLGKTRLHRQLVEVLVSEIASGRYATDELLPREIDLAERYGISRGTVREAIRALEERGVVTVRHGHGAKVAGNASWDILDEAVLGALLRAESGLRVDVLGEVLECRKILEVEAAGLAAKRAGKSEVTAIESALAVMRDAASPGPFSKGEADPFLEADLAFHEAVMAAAGNRALHQLTRSVRSSLLAARRPLARPQDRISRAVPEHANVYEAIAGGDAEGAREAMTKVLSTVEGYYQEYVAARGNPAKASGRRRRSSGPVRSSAAGDHPSVHG